MKSWRELLQLDELADCGSNDPDAEYEETVAKARAVVRALAMARR